MAGRQEVEHQLFHWLRRPLLLVRCCVGAKNKVWQAGLSGYAGIDYVDLQFDASPRLKIVSAASGISRPRSKTGVTSDSRYWKIQNGMTL